MRLSDLLYPGEYTSQHNIEDISVSRISSNINELDSETLFFCLKGNKIDTHTMISSLAVRGVAAIVIEEGAVSPKEGVPLVRVPSTRRALAFAWNRFVGEPTRALKIIGVTGTNGKTSTVYLLDAILRARGIRTAMIGTLGTYIGDVRQNATPDTRTMTMTTPDPDLLYPILARARDAGVTHVVMEVSSHALAQERVAPISFTEAIFTNLTPEHLDYHRSMEEYAAAKGALFRLSEHATINCDDACGAAISAGLSYPHTRCGILWECDASGSLLSSDDRDKYTFFYRYGKIRQLVKLSIAGHYQVYNALLALTAALHLGVSAGDACRALAAVAHIPGRLQEISTEEDDIHVYIDFAHTEAALRSLLGGLRNITHNRLVLVFGCGGERDAAKRPLMGKCAMECADYTVITSDNCRREDVTAIIKDILMGHTDAAKRRVIPDREAAIRHAILTAEKYDTVVLAGKGHEKYEIKRDGIHPFDEVQIAQAALNERRIKRSARYTEE